MARNGNLDEALALCLARGESRQKAATSCGCSVRHVYDRCGEMDFTSRVAELRQAMTGEAVGRLASLAGKAVETFEKLLDDEDPRVRLRAAAAVLTHLASFRQDLNWDELA